MKSLRSRLIDKNQRSILLSNIGASSQVDDLRVDTRCDGFGRIRHFGVDKMVDWCSDPLPMFPASKALGVSLDRASPAFVFQLAVCAFRCWYCFVDDRCLAADPTVSRMVSVSKMLDCYFSDGDRPLVIDLSGGNPGLVPEWSVWVIEGIFEKWSDKAVFVWIDDSLFKDLYGECLTSKEIGTLKDCPFFASVACFKGFDAESFAFNTGSPPWRYRRQLEVFRSLFGYGWDIYAYVTFTTPNVENLKSKMKSFVDELQRIDSALPLRTVPLEIKMYSPTKNRMTDDRYLSMRNQYDVLDVWSGELETRFSSQELESAITDIEFESRRR